MPNLTTCITRLKPAILLVISAAITLTMITVPAEVYRSVDKDGNVTYSDTPHTGAEIIEVQNPTLIPAAKPGTKQRSNAAEKVTAKPYSKIAIVKPADEQTLRNVQQVSVGIQLIPGLQSQFGHKLQLLMDGSAVGPAGGSLSYTLPNVDRGAHVLQAVILDRDGKVFARSANSQFFLHKQAVKRAP